MKKGHLIAGIACILILILVVQGATAGLIERSVIPAGNSTYRVLLQIPEETVTGITETISGGMDYGEISLSPGQYQINGTTLSLAVIGEREVSYLLTTKPGEPGEISGTYKDMLAGEEGNLPGARISGSGSVEITPAAIEDLSSREDAGANTTPLDPGLFVVALCTGGLLSLSRMEKR